MHVDLYPKLFRILNTAWAGAVTLIFALEMREPSIGAVTGVIFWSIYLLASIGTMFDNRVSWTVCIVQLIAIWALMGLVVSDQSFEFFTGRKVGPVEGGRSINMLVFNSFFGILVPASVMIILLVLSHAHVGFILLQRNRPRLKRPNQPHRA